MDELACQWSPDCETKVWGWSFFDRGELSQTFQIATWQMTLVQWALIRQTPSAVCRVHIPSQMTCAMTIHRFVRWSADHFWEQHLWFSWLLSSGIVNRCAAKNATSSTNCCPAKQNLLSLKPKSIKLCLVIWLWWCLILMWKKESNSAIFALCSCCAWNTILKEHAGGMSTFKEFGIGVHCWLQWWHILRWAMCCIFWAIGIFDTEWKGCIGQHFHQLWSFHLPSHWALEATNKLASSFRAGLTCRQDFAHQKWQHSVPWMITTNLIHQIQQTLLTRRFAKISVGWTTTNYLGCRCAHGKESSKRRAWKIIVRWIRDHWQQETSRWMRGLLNVVDVRRAVKSPVPSRSTPRNSVFVQVSGFDLVSNLFTITY